MQHGRVQIVHFHLVARRRKAQIVRAAQRHPRLHAAARHPKRERVDVMVAARLAGIPHFAHRRAPELPAPHHQRVLQQPALLQIFDQRRRRLIDLARHLFQRLPQIGMVIPVRVIKLHEPHPALHQPPGQQTVIRVAGLARLRPVHLQRLFRFFAEIDQFRSARLHPVSHLIGRHARRDFRIARLRQLRQIQIPNRLDRLRLRVRRNSLRPRQIQNRISARPERHTLIRRRQKSAGPQRRPATRPPRTRLQHHKPRQIVRLAADPVRDPRAHARPPKPRRPRIRKTFRRTVVEVLRRNALQKRDIVRNPRDMRNQFGKPRPGLAVLFELPRRPQQLRLLFRERIHERKPFARHQLFRHGLVVILLQSRFVVVEFELARRARHEQVNNVLRLRGKMPRLRLQRIRRGARGRSRETLPVVQQ